MRRVRAGEVELFDLLVRRYRGPLLNVAWSKLGEAAWAEDVVQETFLAAFASRASYRPEFSFRTWLWTILLNLCRRQWRRRQTRPREHSLSSAAPADLAGYREPVAGESPLEKALKTEGRARVQRLLEQLPEPQADALRLRFFGELPFADIAAAMGSSVSGAKQRVRLGLIALSEQLREERRERS